MDSTNGNHQSAAARLRGLRRFLLLTWGLRTRLYAFASFAGLRRRTLSRALVVFVFFILLFPALAQNPFDDYRSFRQRPTLVRPEATGPSFGEFTFIRTIYDSHSGGYGYRRRSMWATDYPEADNNLIVGLREWAGTNLKIAPRPEQIAIMDDRIFDYPMIYFVEPGFLELSDEQAARLREYVARGGFMFFDDFWVFTKLKIWRLSFTRSGPTARSRNCRFRIPSFIRTSILMKSCKFLISTMRSAAKHQKKA